jgi:hypothetical protein
MDVRRDSEAPPTRNRTQVERTSECELVVTRMVNAPAKWMFALGGSIVCCFVTKIRRWSSLARTSK